MAIRVHLIGSVLAGEAQPCEEGEAVKHQSQLQDSFQRAKVRATWLGAAQLVR